MDEEDAPLLYVTGSDGTYGGKKRGRLLTLAARRPGEHGVGRVSAAPSSLISRPSCRSPCTMHHAPYAVRRTPRTVHSKPKFCNPAVSHPTPLNSHLPLPPRRFFLHDRLGIRWNSRVLFLGKRHKYELHRFLGALVSSVPCRVMSWFCPVHDTAKHLAAAVARSTIC